MASPPCRQSLLFYRNSHCTLLLGQKGGTFADLTGSKTQPNDGHAGFDPGSRSRRWRWRVSQAQDWQQHDYGLRTEVGQIASTVFVS